MHGKRIFGSLDPFFETGGIMGRSTANAGFIRALLRRDPFDGYMLFPGEVGSLTHLMQTVEAEFPQMLSKGKFVARLRTELPGALAENAFYCFHLSDCINHPGYIARLRNAYSGHVFPITSLIHSLSVARYPASFLAHMWPGCTQRDCIVATSRAGESAVRQFFSMLRRGYNLQAEEFPQPRIRRIPLGIEPDSILPATPNEKTESRKAYDIPKNACVVLTLARISHHSKADLVPVMRAFQRIAAAGGDLKEFYWILAGWVEQEDDLPGVLNTAAASLGLPLRIVRCPDDAEKLRLFKTADVFLSPADNLQETFGLTMLEAGAAGLPVIATDFDGYRDIVVHEETGLLVPVLGPDNTERIDDFAPVLFDNQYLLQLAQQTAADVAVMAEYLQRLKDDSGLRKTMGTAARKRIEENYSWDAVVDAYLELWADLWSAKVDEQRLASLSHPLRTPFGEVFQSYPTAVLQDDMRFCWSTAGKAVYQGNDHIVVYGGIADRIPEDALKFLLFTSRKGANVSDLKTKVTTVHSMPEEDVRFLILWAYKQGFLERCP